MISVSQNRKIALAAIAIFGVSFAFMMLFLGGERLNSVKTDSLHIGANTHSTEESHEEAATFVTDSEGKFTYTQIDFCHAMGAGCSSLLGKSVFDFVNKGDVSSLVSSYTKLIQDHESFENEGPFRLGLGKYERVVLLSAEPLVVDNKVSEIKFIVNDISDKLENPDEEEWSENIYPKIKDMGSEYGRLMVEKITYIAD